jgi:hypothetical protein
MSTTLSREDMREARRQIMAITDPTAQTALFTLLGLLQQLAERLDKQESHR